MAKLGRKSKTEEMRMKLEAQEAAVAVEEVVVVQALLKVAKVTESMWMKTTSIIVLKLDSYSLF